MSRNFVHAGILLCTLLFPPAIAEQKLGIEVPESFEVTRFAGDDLAHDIYSMTINSHGEVVVSGRGYVKILLDSDDDGVADTAKLFSKLPAAGAKGMVFDGNDLLCTGDNRLMRQTDSNGNGIADGVFYWANLKNPEHGANGLTQGPDGWFYLICGNDAGVSRKDASLTSSPIKNPECGALLRFRPDGKVSEIVAHGFRNPYDIAFNSKGHVFTVDADGERDQHLPWYTPTRLFDIAVGQHHGWILRGWKASWSRPKCFFDNVPRVAELGRGSPTGLTTYRHRHFPKRYRDGIFSCCWTLGRVYFCPLEKHQSSYQSNPEVFLKTTGQVGFAPVDLAVGPDGDLFVAIGGRRTQGGVFRIRYVGVKETESADEPQNAAEASIARVLNADQPLSAWSRKTWEPLAQILGSAPFEKAATEESRPTNERIRAIEVLVDQFQDLSDSTLDKLAQTKNPEVAARLAWALARVKHHHALARLLETISKQHPESWEVQRAVSETAAVLNLSITTSALADRFVRANQIKLPSGDSAADTAATPTIVSLARQQRSNQFDDDSVKQTLQIFLNSLNAGNVIDQFASIRILQLALDDIARPDHFPEYIPGYHATRPESVNESQRIAIATELSKTFPTENETLDFEIARLVGMLQVPDSGFLNRIPQKWTEQSTVESDLHYLMVASRIPGPRSSEFTSACAAAIANLHRKMRTQRKFTSRNWPTWVRLTLKNLLAHDNRLANSIVADPNFGLPGHATFVTHFDNETKVDAIIKIVETIDNSDNDLEWTPDVVDVVASLPKSQGLTLLRQNWPDFRLRPRIVTHLARQPTIIDRQIYLEALDLAQPKSVEMAVKAIDKIQVKPTAAEIAKILQTLRRFSVGDRYKGLQAACSSLLQKWSNDRSQKTLDEWTSWYQKTYPDGPPTQRPTTSTKQWSERIERIDWSNGDSIRGKKVFAKRACAGCHSGNSRLGPNLAPVTSRFSKHDLFMAIVDPNRDVSPLYQTTQFVTESGNAYNGLVIYQSPDGTLVQTGTDTIVRIEGEQIVESSPSRVSLMPAGLLDAATNQEIADLYAYLQSLQKKK